MKALIPDKTNRPTQTACCLGPSPNCMPWSDRDAQEEKKNPATASSAGVTQIVCTLFV